MEYTEKRMIKNRIMSNLSEEFKGSNSEELVKMEFGC
jgi:hypothetical protein